MLIDIINYKKIQKKYVISNTYSCNSIEKKSLKHFVNENDTYKILINEKNEFLKEIYLGNVKLQFETNSTSGNRIHTVLLDYPSHQIKRDNRFNFFQNLAGNSSLNFIYGDHNSVYKIELFIKPKINENLIDYWLEEIFLNFPMIEIHPQIAQITDINTKIDKSQDHFSLAYLIKITEKITENLSTDLLNINYLPYKKRFIDTSFKSSQSNSIVKKIKNGSLTNWKKVKYNSNSYIRKGIITYELSKIPQKKLYKTYDLDINFGLVKVLKTLLEKLNFFINKNNNHNLFFKEPKGVIGNNIESPYKVITSYEKKIKLCTIKINNIIDFLKSIGIEENYKKLSFYDNRYPQISKTINLILLLNKTYGSFENLSSSKFPIPTLDYIFEIFCLSLIDQYFKRNDFKVIDSKLDLGLNHYSLFQSIDKKIKISIFYDRNADKYGSSSNPLKDTRVGEVISPYRPDFTLTFDIEGNEFIVILDAKYKNKNKTKDTLKPGGGRDSLVTKYFSFKAGLTEVPMPPCFIGALCFEDDEFGELSSMQDDFFSVKGQQQSYFQVYYQSLSHRAHDEIYNFFDVIFNHIFYLYNHNNFFKKVEFKRKIEPLYKEIKPEIQNKKTQQNLNVSFLYKPNNRKLSDEVVAKIKGMLNRGDRQQDIANLFSVPSGTISSIKRELIYIKVKPQEANLPSIGPQPSSYDLMYSS